MKIDSNKVLFNLVEPSKLWKLKFIAAWNSALGSLSSKIILEKIEESTIYLKITDTCLANDLNLKKSALLKRFNQMVGEIKFTNIFIKIGSNKKSICKKNLPIARKKESPYDTLGFREEEALKKISTDELKQSLKKLFKLCQKQESHG